MKKLQSSTDATRERKKERKKEEREKERNRLVLSDPFAPNSNSVLSLVWPGKLFVVSPRFSFGTQDVQYGMRERERRREREERERERKEDDDVVSRRGQL